MVKLTALLLLSLASQSFALPHRRLKRNCDDVKLSVPSNLPNGASKTIAQDFASFSIEWVDMIDYLGTPGNPSTFTINILQNLKDRTGVSPIIRSSGSSVDAFLLDENKINLDSIKGAYDNKFYLSKKSDYRPNDKNINNPPDLGFLATMLEISNKVGTKWIIGLNFGQNDLDNTKLVAKLGSLVLGKYLHAYELGNEPSQYGGSSRQFRNSNWDVDAYINQNAQWTNEIQDAVSKITDNPPEFQGGALCCGWKARDLIDAGFFKKAGKPTTSISEHHYWGACPDKMTTIMDHKGITDSLDKLIGDSIELSDDAGKDYVLGEFNTFMHGGCEGVSNAFGASLFGVDIMMWSASRNVKRAHMHSSSFVVYSIWYGADRNTAGPLYYSYLMMAEAIGDSGNTKVKALDTGSDSVSAYAFYDGDNLKRLALINLNIVEKHKNTTKIDASHVSINGPSNSRVTLKRLYADSTFVQHHIWWGGQTMYQSPDGELLGKEVREVVDVPDSGDFVVSVDCSTAVLIFFD